jgi:hypothetical protein
MKLLLATVLALTFAGVAAAKSFEPGDLRLCNANRCVPIRDRAALDAMSRLYYGSPAPRPAVAPHNGTRVFRLEFTNGYVTGWTAGISLDRFLSGGVNLGQFSRGRWYHIPPAAAAELRHLAVRLTPMRLTRSLATNPY